MLLQFYPKLVFPLSVILCFSSCNSKRPISGKLEGQGKETSKVYLVQPLKLNEVAAPFLGTILDTSEVAKDGSFAFQNLPQSEEPILLEIVVQSGANAPNELENDNLETSNYMPVIWNNGESIYIDSNLEAFQKEFSMEKPSKANQALLELRDMRLKAYKEFLEGKTWHVEEGSQLLEKEKAVMSFKEGIMDFAKKTDELLPALMAVRWVSPENDYERFPEFQFQQCQKWQQTFPEHSWVKELCVQSDKSNLPVMVGDTFPDSELPLVSGDTISVYESLGKKLTIVDMWASWCAPCRKENREVLVPLWEQYHNEGLQILAYGLESDQSAWESAIEKDGANRWLQASHLVGDDTPFLKSLRIQTIPANYILDTDGKIIAKNVHGEALLTFVKNYMDTVSNE